MNRMLNLTKYLCRNYLQLLGGYYLGINLFMIIIFVLAKYFSGDSGVTGFGNEGSDISSIFILLILIIINFKHSFGFSQNNLLSRKYHIFATILATLFISIVLAISETIIIDFIYSVIGWKHTNVINYNNLFYSITAISMISLLLLSFANFLALITYRMNKWFKLVFFVAPAVLFPILINSTINFLIESQANWVIDLLIDLLIFISDCFATLPRLTISCLIATSVIWSINYGVIHLLPLKLDKGE